MAEGGQNYWPLTTHLLERAVADVQVTQVESFEALNQALSEQRLPSLVLLDLKLSDTQGMDGLLFLKKQYPSLPILIISAYDDKAVVRKAMQYGASGFVPKSLEMDRMAEVIHEVLDGEMWFPEISDEIDEPATAADSPLESLTPAQLKVLALLRDGRPSKEIAAIMSVTEATIKAHLTEIFRKLKVKNRTQAALAAKDLDLPEGPTLQERACSRKNTAPVRNHVIIIRCQGSSYAPYPVATQDAASLCCRASIAVCSTDRSLAGSTGLARNWNPACKAERSTSGACSAVMSTPRKGAGDTAR